MKNQDDIEPTGERDELHELLCAYMLGETGAAESARIETELKNNAELRANRDSLQATIGLVKRFADQDATLPDSAHAELAAKTGGGATVHSLAWYRSSSVRAAAAVLVAVGAGFAAMPYLSAPMAPAPEGATIVGQVSPAESAEVPVPNSTKDLAFTSANSSSSPKESHDAGYYRGAGDTVPPGSDSGGALKKLAPEVDAYNLGRRSAGIQPAPSPKPGDSSALRLGQVGGESTSELSSLHVSGGFDSKAPSSSSSAGDSTGLESLSGVDLRGLGYADYLSSAPKLSQPGQLEFVHEASGYALGLGQDPSVPAAAFGLVEGLEVQSTDEDLARIVNLRAFELERSASGSDLSDLDDRARRAPDQAWLRVEGELLERLGLEDDAAARIGLLQGLGILEDEFDGSIDDPRVIERRQLVVSAEAARQEVEGLLGSCLRQPGESLQDMFFRHWGTRPIVETADDPLSTFSIDVDTASYTLARGMLDRGILPGREQIRPEEFVNYFHAEVPAPAEETFSLATEMAPNPFGPDGSWLLRTVVKAKDVPDSERESLALVFVVDVSGSMDTDHRIELVKDALGQLLTKLDGRDRIALVAFAKTAKVILPMTPADRRGPILTAIEGLSTGGGTNVEAGLVGGYELAAREFDPELQNRVVLLSDGVGNIGETDQEKLLEQVAEHRAKGLYLNTIGFGISNHNDVFLEQLADGGDGQCNYVDSPVEARKAFVENFTGAFQTVARDVKIQVEFDALRVGGYRLIGYENRAIADREFRQDSVDAGEVGAGQEVVAVYELFNVDLSGEDASGLGTLRLRFKPPFSEGSDEARELEQPFGAAVASFDYPSASSGFRKSTLVAQTADVLRRSWHASGDSMLTLASEIERLANQTRDPDFSEFAALFERNRAAIESSLKPASDNQRILDELKQLRYELELEREAEGTPDSSQLESLEQRITEREEALRENVLANLPVIER